MGNFNTLQALDWDSDFFKKKIAKIDLQDIELNSTQINRLIADSSFDLIYCFAQADEGEIPFITSMLHHAMWVDGKATYLKTVEAKSIDENPFFESVRHIDEDLYDLAIQTGVYSRFHVDNNFEQNQYKELYKKWIENSVNRTIADEVIVYKENQKNLALITLGIKNARTDIGLLGVDEHARGKGIASQLLAYAECYAANKNFKEMQVVTQTQNEPACRLYEKYGFYVDSLVNIFHIWK
ncbi:MAG: GNAT family N-acetyltransferase [Limnohabitans sp.]|nr:GNAT family N-acetyltransferase [Limnohabitans sp.]